jgi:hypothetical protein
MKGNRLPILLLLLIVAGGGYWFISAKRAADYSRSPAGIQEAVQARTRLSGAINQTIIRLQKKTQQWPKTLADIRNEPELKEFSDRDLEGVTYRLKDVKENVATYEIDFRGRKNTNKMAAWRPGFEKPPGGPAGMAAAGS